jgi:hypothetical protein
MVGSVIAAGKPVGDSGEEVVHSGHDTFGGLKQVAGATGLLEIYGKGTSIISRLGYSGSGGLGAREDGIVVPLGAKKWLKKRGVGSATGQEVWAFAAGLVEDEDEGEVFLAERIRRALKKLTPEERWLFNTRLRGGPFEDLLLSKEQLEKEMSGERPVLMVGAQTGGVRSHSSQEEQGMVRQVTVKTSEGTVNDSISRRRRPTRVPSKGVRAKRLVHHKGV